MPWPGRAEDIELAFEAPKGRADALYVVADPLMTTNQIHIKGSHGFDEQIFGANEQILERGQTYLSGIGLKAMWEEQRTGTLLLPPQSEEAEFNLLCQLRP